MPPNFSKRSQTAFSLIAELQHEIRSPVNSILNTAELGLMENPVPSIKRYLETIEKSAISLLGLLDDIISFADEEEYSDSRCPFFLTCLLEEVKDIVDTSMKADSTVMVLKIGDGTPESFHGPGARIRQVLTKVFEFAISRLDPKQLSLNLGYSPSEGLRFEVEVFPVSCESMHSDLGLKNDHRLLICRSLLSGSGKRLETEKRDQSLVFTFSIPVTMVSERGDRFFEPDFYKEVPAAVMVNSDSFSSELTCRRLGFEGISVTNVPSLRKAAEYMAEGISSGDVSRRICLLNWEDVKGRQDLGISFIRSATGVKELPVVLMEIPAVEMMNLTAGQRFPRSKAGGAVGLVMKHAGVRKVLMEMGGVLGRNPEENFVLNRDEDGPAAGAAKDIFTGLTVLVVEDDRINQKILVEILKKRGIKPVVASSGASALNALQRKRFDVVLMDINLPDSDGYKLTESIRSTGDNSETPVIALTASTRNRQTCLDAGMNDYLPKPYSEEKIFSVLSRWIRTDRAT